MMKDRRDELILGGTLFTLSDVFLFYRKEKRFPKLRDLLKRVHDMRAEGLAFLELPLHQTSFFPEVFTPGIMRRAGLEALECGFLLSAHVPLPGVQLVSHLELPRRASVAVILESVKPLMDLPIRSFVSHVEGEFYEWMDQDAKGTMHQQFHERAFEAGSRSIAELLRVIPRDKLLLENLPRTNLDLLRRWSERFKVGLCLDIGHIYLARKDLRRSVVQLGRRVRHVHLHDIVWKRAKSGRRYLDDHQALGTGILDLGAFLDLRRRYFGRAALILEQRWHWARRSARVLRKLGRT
jgi:sugar phosphate isomerase/epimerase